MSTSTKIPGRRLPRPLAFRGRRERSFPRKGSIVAALLAALGLLALPSMVAAGGTGWVVGAEGELLQLISGRYGDLFPDGVDAPADAAVLALAVQRGDESELLLVPASASMQVEDSYRLVHDDMAGVSYLLWESTINGIHPLIHVVAYDGASWSEVREITGSVFSEKGHPRMAVTRDSHSLGDGTSFDRTVLHVVWWEDTAGLVKKRYAPVVLENGQFLDTQTVRDLSSIFVFEGDAGEGDGGGDPLASTLDRTLRFQPGPNPRSVLLGQVNTWSGDVESLQLEVLPQALSRLAAIAAAAVAELPEDAGMELVESTLRQVLADSGTGFREATLESMLADLVNLVGAALEDGDDFESITDEMGARIVIIGMRIEPNGLEEVGRGELLEIRRGDDDFDHHLEVRRRGSWPEPGAGEGARLFLSRTGSNVLVAWPAEDGASVIYRIGLEQGLWTEPAELALVEGLDLEGAMGLLEAKILAR